ncbi:MAG: phosphoribosyl-ATP diphosphatase [Proteobacteria bacterium]|nr:phosphoribosyl-ATP diphosphatase [Pseudomonadota bacterium]
MDSILERLTVILQERRNADPSSSYVAGLHAKGVNKILEKVGEETTEVILAAKEAEISGNVEELVKETADLWFHTMVLLGHMESSPAAVLEELERRFGTSGLEEKASRSK